MSLFCCLTTRSLDEERNVSNIYCKSYSGDGVYWLWHGNIYHGGFFLLVYFDPAIVSMYYGFLRRSQVFSCVVGFDVFLL